MPAGSTACVKCTKKMNGITTSDKSISNEDDNDNLNYDHGYSQKIGDNADGSVS